MVLFAAILDEMPMLVNEWVDNFDTMEDRLQAFGVAVQAFNVLSEALVMFVNSNPAEELARQLEQSTLSSTEKLQNFGEALRTALDNFEGTPAQMAEIAALMGARYQAEMEYLMAVHQVVMSITDSITSQQERIREAIEAQARGELTFDELFNQAQALLPSLFNAESPEELGRIVGDIQKLIDEAFGKLAPEQYATDGQTLLSFLDEVLAFAQAQGQALADAATEEGDALRDQASAFATEFGIELEPTTQAVNNVNTTLANQTDQLTARLDNIDTNTQSTDSAVRELLAWLQENRDEAPRTGFVTGG